MEAELDKRHLSLLFSCLKSGNTKFVLLAKRQSLSYNSEGGSFFTRVKHILTLSVIWTFPKISGK